MKTKDTSVQTAFNPILTALLFAVDRAYRDWNSELIITSGSEHSARHGKTSLHYAIPCCAADTRTWELESNGTLIDAKTQYEEIRKVRDIFCIQQAIPSSWIDIILESNHIHIEFQPKRQD